MPQIILYNVSCFEPLRYVLCLINHWSFIYTIDHFRKKLS